LSDAPDLPDFVAQWEIWHVDHERRRTRPHGFLAITGLHWLSGESVRFDDVPGEWSSDVDGVEVLLGVDEELDVDAKRVRGRHRFDDVDEHGTFAEFGESIVEVCRREGNFMIRPRHPDNEVRTSYAGTPTYPVSTQWVATGSFVPYSDPRPVSVDATVEGLTHVYVSPGEISFVLAGHDLRLITFNDDEPDSLFIVFTDLTAGNTSYAACRFLSVTAPDADGRVTLDFNRATNPPCAYTDFATCPLPPRGNHLSVRVEAGEMAPATTLPTSRG
jgi:hypothetical protein